MRSLRWLTRFRYALYNWWHFKIFSSRECSLVAHGLKVLAADRTRSFNAPSWIVVSDALDCAYLTDSNKIRSCLRAEELTSGIPAYDSVLSVIHTKYQRPVWEWFNIPSAAKLAWPSSVDSAENSKPPGSETPKVQCIDVVISE